MAKRSAPVDRGLRSSRRQDDRLTRNAWVSGARHGQRLATRAASSPTRIVSDAASPWPASRDGNLRPGERAALARPLRIPSPGPG